MTPARKASESRRRQTGYALLAVVFLSALMLLAAVAITPSVLQEGKREKEEELIWRGNQYARAVRLYYRKHGRFPQSLDDLTKAKAGIRYLRKDYKDPMNAEDGSWRMIYVGPGGQLIGSVKPRKALQGLTPAALAQPAKAPAGPAGAPRSGDGQPQEMGQPQTEQPTKGPAPSSSTPATDIGENPKVYGGNIIGVGSKVKKPSIRILDGGSTYYEWEFIWDPSKEPAAVRAPQTQTPARNLNPENLRSPRQPPLQ